MHGQFFLLGSVNEGRREVVRCGERGRKGGWGEGAASYRSFEVSCPNITTRYHPCVHF